MASERRVLLQRSVQRQCTGLAASETVANSAIQGFIQALDAFLDTPQSDVVGRRVYLAALTRASPLPVANLRHVVAVLGDVLFVFKELTVDRLLSVCGLRAELDQQPVHYVLHEVETVHLVHYGHVERSCRRALFFVPADVEIAMIRPPIGQAMDQRRIPVKGEDDGLVLGEKYIEVGVA